MSLPQNNPPSNELRLDVAAAEKEEERRKLRRLQILVGMVSSILSQDPHLTRRGAQRLIADCKTAALTMFPDKELAFDLIYQPRLERVVQERFRSAV
jgi:hypothetical protein